MVNDRDINENLSRFEIVGRKRRARSVALAMCLGVLCSSGLSWLQFKGYGDKVIQVTSQNNVNTGLATSRADQLGIVCAVFSFLFVAGFVHMVWIWVKLDRFEKQRFGPSA
jgi:hypothetical protein